MTPEEQEAERRKRQQAQFRAQRPADTAAAPPAQQKPAPAPPQKAQPPKVTPVQTPISQAAAGGIKVPSAAERAIGAGNRLQFRAKPRAQQQALAPMQKVEAAKPKQGQTPFPSAAGATGSSTQQAMNFGSPGTSTAGAGAPRNTVGAVGQQQRPLVGLAPVAGEATPVAPPPGDTGEQIDAIIEDLLADDADTAAERAALEAQFEADRGRQLADARAAGGFAGLGLSGGQQLLEGDIANAAMRQEAIGLGEFDRAQRAEELARQQLALGALSEQEIRDLYLEVYGEEREAQKEDEAKADSAEARDKFVAGLDVVTTGGPFDAEGSRGRPYSITEGDVAKYGLTPAGEINGSAAYTDDEGRYYIIPGNIFG